jgi:hypothetical protein
VEKASTESVGGDEQWYKPGPSVKRRGGKLAWWRVGGRRHRRRNGVGVVNYRGDLHLLV